MISTASAMETDDDGVLSKVQILLHLYLANLTPLLALYIALSLSPAAITALDLAVLQILFTSLCSVYRSRYFIPCGV